MERVLVAVRLPTDMVEELDRRAGLEDRSRRWVIEELLRVVLTMEGAERGPEA